MRTSGWAKRQPWFWPVKLFLKRIAGKELWIRPSERRDTVTVGDWSLIDSMLDEESVVYSLGVGDNIDFDLEAIDRFGATVYAFDPTPFAEEWVASQELPEQFHFRPWAASGADGSLRLYRRVNTRGRRNKVMWTAEADAGDEEDFVDAPAYTIDSMMQKLSHDRVDLLKMDVEGAEYDIIDGLTPGQGLPRQVLVEFHHRFPGIHKKRTLDSINRLRELGYRIFDVSRTGREIGFVLIGDS